MVLRHVHHCGSSCKVEHMWICRARVLILLVQVQVVSRGGFHVGNGINWKGQVFAKMHNHTSVNKMTVRESEM